MKSELSDFLRDPETYRFAKDYRGTNIVFHAKFDGENFIVKRPRLIITAAIHAYYTFADKFFYGLRRFGSSKESIAREARTLEKLNGCHAPKLIYHNPERGLLIKEYVLGRNLKVLDGERRKIALEYSIIAMRQIHERGIVIGDAHAKNVLYYSGNSNWIDFDCLVDESNKELAMALDILKFVYSTYHLTKDEELTLNCADLASKDSYKKAKLVLKSLVNPGLSSARLWLPCRLPMRGDLNEEIKDILRSS